MKSALIYKTNWSCGEVVDMWKSKNLGDDLRKNKKMNSSTLALIMAFVFMMLGLICGIRPCSVISGSMEPNLPTWSLCFIDTRISYDEIQTGDIVVYNRRSDDMRIIHRVIEITSEGMITKGDANSVSDGFSVGRDNLYGKSLFYIPYLGYWGRFAQKPIIKISIIMCWFVLLMTDIVTSRKTGNTEESKR